MENLKPTQNHEQKQPTPEYDVVATFPVDTDPDNARYPLTIIRRGQDGEDVKYDGGWNPIGMLVVCDTDSEKGIGPIKLFMEVYKLVKVDGEYTTETEIVPLENIQGLEANEDYIKYLYGKTTKEMIEKGKKAARDIWNQKHPVDNGPEYLAPEVRPESSSDGSAVKEVSGHERPSADKADPVMGGVAVNAAGVRKPVETNKVDTNEPVREPVETDKTGAGSSTLVMTEEVMASIGAIKVNDPGSLAATEIVREEPVETDRASADLVDLPVTESVENPVETNEASTDILPESFKSVINNFEKDTKKNNGEFFAKAKYIAGELDRLRVLIKYNPTAMNDPAISEMITSEPDRIRDLEDSRAKDANKFKNKINNILEGLEKKIKNDDERRRLVKLTEHVNQMGEDNTVLGDTTNDLLDKLIRIRSNIAESQSSSWGIDYYRSNIAQVIDGIINDLSTASGRRQNIVDGIERIKSEGYYQKR